MPPYQSSRPPSVRPAARISNRPGSVSTRPSSLPPNRVSAKVTRIAAIALLLLTLPLLYTVFDTNDGDVPLYHRIASLLFEGSMPYRDYKFEYPPYALAFFVIPGLATSYSGFRIVFSLQLLALDVIAKVLLFRNGMNRGPREGEPAFLPKRFSEFAPFVPVFLYSVGGIFQTYFALKRLDLVAASLTLFALIAFSRGRYVVTGVLVAVAVGTKLYPILLAPMLLHVAWKRGKVRPLLLGGAIGIAPLALLSLLFPWWRFAAFHAARGLQVESTYASILWLLHFVGLDATWAGRTAWMDVDGPAAIALLPIARVLFGLTTIASVALSVMAVRRRSNVTPAFLARVSLVPVIAFMTFNIVLSPQYAIWLIGPTAIAMTEGKRAPIVAIALAVVLTMFVFPAPGYLTGAGIGLGRTIVLVTRNLALLVALVLLVRETITREGSDEPRSNEPRVNETSLRPPRVPRF